MTEVPKRSYLLGFNVFAFREVYVLQGYGGTQYVEASQALLRSRVYEQGPYSGGAPNGAICGLQPRRPQGGRGRHDSKVRSASLFARGKGMAWAVTKWSRRAPSV